jgi:hypothetical protein
MACGKIMDLRRQHKEAYAAHEVPRIIDAGRTWCVALTGRGDPESAAFRESMETLLSLVQRMKRAARDRGRDFKVMPLECVYWCARRGSDLSSTPREKWHWRILVRVPQFIGGQDLALACADLEARRPAALARAAKLEWLEEGHCAQALHLGDHADEHATIERMRALAREQGFALGPPHHEIHLSDPMEARPDRQRTLVRLPVVRMAASR